MVRNQTYLSNQKANRSKFWWFEPLQAHHLTCLISEYSALKRNTPQTVTKRSTAETQDAASATNGWKHPSKSERSQQKAFTSEPGRNPTINESDENTSTNRCCFNNKSWKHPKITPLTVESDEIHLRNKVWSISIKVWQQHHNGSIWCTSNTQDAAQAMRSTSETLTGLNSNVWQHQPITWRKNLQHCKV